MGATRLATSFQLASRRGSTTCFDTHTAQLSSSPSALKHLIGRPPGRGPGMSATMSTAGGHGSHCPTDHRPGLSPLLAHQHAKGCHVLRGSVPVALRAIEGLPLGHTQHAYQLLCCTQWLTATSTPSNADNNPQLHISYYGNPKPGSDSVFTLIDDANRIPAAATVLPSPLLQQLPALVSHHKWRTNQHGAGAPLEAGVCDAMLLWFVAALSYRLLSGCQSRFLRPIEHHCGASSPCCMLHGALNSTSFCKASHDTRLRPINVRLP
jgi:hypothetical protein